MKYLITFPSWRGECAIVFFKLKIRDKVHHSLEQEKSIVALNILFVHGHCGAKFEAQSQTSDCIYFSGRRRPYELEIP